MSTTEPRTGGGSSTPTRDLGCRRRSPRRKGEPFSLTTGGGIYTGSKDYTFFGAISGVRNESGVPPLFSPRGLPHNRSPELQRYLDAEGELGEFGTGWLRLSEVNAALDHQHVDRSLLSFEMHTILAVMQNLAERLGDDRVRLVFGFLG